MLEWYIIRYMMQNGLPLLLHLPMIRKNVLLNRPRLLQHLIWRHVQRRLTVSDTSGFFLQLCELCGLIGIWIGGLL